MDDINLLMFLLSIFLAFIGIFFFAYACYLVFWGCPM